MNEPKSLPLSDNPRTKKVKLYKLESSVKFDEREKLDITNEDNQQNNSQSIQQLESDQTN